MTITIEMDSSCWQHRCSASDAAWAQVDYDLLQSHMIAISGVKPCGACDE